MHLLDFLYVKGTKNDAPNVSDLAWQDPLDPSGSHKTTPTGAVNLRQ